MAGVGGNNRAGREEKQINTSAEEEAKKEAILWRRTRLPLSPVVRTEDRDYAGLLPVLRKGLSWPFHLYGVTEYTLPSNLHCAL